MSAFREFLPISSGGVENNFTLFYPTTPHDLPDKIEFEMRQLHLEWSNLTIMEITPLIIGKKVDRGSMLRLLYAFLTENERETYYHLMKMLLPTGKDWKEMIEVLKYFTFTKFYLLRFEVKERILELVERMVGIPLVDGLICGLWRQYRPGRREKENLFLLERLLLISERSLDYLGMLPYLLFCLIRTAREGGLSEFLYAKMDELIVKILHERLKEALLPLGIEGLLCLLQTSQKRAFLISWLVKNSLIKQLMLADQKKIKYVAMRILPIMEKRINWIIQEIDNNDSNNRSINWYLDLFFKDFIAEGMDEEGQVIDLLRYITLKGNDILLKGVLRRIPCITENMKLSLCLNSILSSKELQHHSEYVWYETFLIKVKESYPFLFINYQ